MSKSNKKKNRTDGTITSNNNEFPVPMIISNTKTADTNFTDKDRINIHSKTNQLL